MNNQFEKLVSNPNFGNVRVWAHERNLIEKGDVQTQAIKLFEEFGELCGSVLKNKRDVLIDSVGDMIVVMINICEIKNGIKMEDHILKIAKDEESKNDMLSNIGYNVYLLSKPAANILTPINNIVSSLCLICKLEGLEISDCLDFAYNEIKDRTGKMVDGNFVKD